MHKLGCPQRNNQYAHCECEAMDLREHTEQLRQFNENAQQAKQESPEPPWTEEDPRMLREQIRVADAAYQNLHERHEALKADRENVPSHYPRSALKLALALGLVAGFGTGCLLTFILTRPPSEQVKRAQIEERQAVISALQGALTGLNEALEKQRQPEPLPTFKVQEWRPLMTLAISNALSLGQKVTVEADTAGNVHMQMSK